MSRLAPCLPRDGRVYDRANEHAPCLATDTATKRTPRAAAGHTPEACKASEGPPTPPSPCSACDDAWWGMALWCAAPALLLPLVTSRSRQAGLKAKDRLLARFPTLLSAGGG